MIMAMMPPAGLLVVSVPPPAACICDVDAMGESAFGADGGVLFHSTASRGGEMMVMPEIPAFVKKSFAWLAEKRSCSSRTLTLFERVSLMSRISTRILTDAATTVTTTLEAGTPASVAMAAAMLSRRAVSKSETSPAARI